MLEVANGSVEAVVTRDPGVFESIVDLPSDSAILGVVAAYASMGVNALPVAGSPGAVAVRDWRAPRRILGQPLSRLFRCSDGTMTGGTADDIPVYVTLMTSAIPAPGGGARLRTAVEARGIRADGRAGGRQPCSSTGRLEGMLHERAAQGRGTAASHPASRP